MRDDPILDVDVDGDVEETGEEKRVAYLAWVRSIGTWRSSMKYGGWCTGSYEVVGPNLVHEVVGMNARTELAAKMLKERYKILGEIGLRS